ncbi:anti-phage deoxyguanosine triphosphatase [Vibrio marisflavi]|uniref:Deoxyguanosinetriphosphate triphosphohydrolase-like protein n=1 Tax=Vibrio marisflavi CECT 7928 TaxID=634439 RepID=A0ABN8E7X8_9VIBR|nr:anti-phage deoxyguanosine triphosphatase [Vibrio marisflavi]CAH0539311.1 Deoxyguanosinetriphosphate triphosphohydrolase-like protein [Vibrio marisflavi CECT 7928]
MPETIDSAWRQRNKQENKLRLNDHRSPFERDRARILHSAAFRRLQSKTQVHCSSTDDFHRTRLTHSLEVAQLGTGIVAQIKSKQPEVCEILPSDSLIDSICLAHDIGHPPYGHGGEVALNYMMRDHGGFEGNAQTFRIVTQLEPYTENGGMNLTRRSLLGLLKYPALISQTQAKVKPKSTADQRKLKTQEWLPAKGIYDCDHTLLNWVLSPLSQSDQEKFVALRDTNCPRKQNNKTLHKSLDCSIMELADDIAYGVHDLEDAIVLGMVSYSQWCSEAESQLKQIGDDWFSQHIVTLGKMLFSGKHHQRKDAIGGIVNALLTSVTIQSTAESFESPLLSSNAYLAPSRAAALDVLKKFVNDFVIQIPEVQIVEYKGQQVIMNIFEALSSEPNRLLPNLEKQKWQLAAGNADAENRIIADYISSMTDGHALRLHTQLFSPV